MKQIKKYRHIRTIIQRNNIASVCSSLTSGVSQTDGRHITTRRTAHMRRLDDGCLRTVTPFQFPGRCAAVNRHGQTPQGMQNVHRGYTKECMFSIHWR